MKYFFVLFLIFISVISSFAKVIHVPKECRSIQEGICLARSGDTVLVNPGTYMENIDYCGKNIVIASLILNSGDRSFRHRTVIDGNQCGSVVSFKNCENESAHLIGFTIINGCSEQGGGIYCSNSSPTLSNLVIKNNRASPSGGGGIGCFNQSNPELKNVVIENNSAAGTSGGGIVCSDSHLRLENVQINNNSAYYGGGMCCYNSDLEISQTEIFENIAKGYGAGLWCRNSNIDLNHVIIGNNSAVAKGGGIRSIQSKLSFRNLTICNNSAELGGGGICMDKRSNLDFCSENSCNIFLNRTNTGFGNDIYLTSKIPNLIHVIVDTFTVINTTDRYIYPLENFNIDLLNKKITTVKSDLYVNSTGNDSNSGTSHTDPLKSINLALMKIGADSLNPRTVFLANGIYNRSESPYPFRIFIPDYVSLKGESQHGVILNAEKQENVIVVKNNHGSTVEDLTITGGSSRYGGGIRCENSRLNLFNVTIKDNKAEKRGGAIYTRESELNMTNMNISGNVANLGGGLNIYKSITRLRNVKVTGNCASKRGGGLFLNSSTVKLSDVTIKYNSAEELGGGVFCALTDISLSNISIHKNNANLGGGGIYFYRTSVANFCCENRCNIYSNEAQTGNDLYNTDRYNIIEVALDTFTVLNPTDHYAYRFDRFTFDILRQTTIYDITNTLPVAFNLSQNYPNPFNPSTKIEYSLPKHEYVTVEVYNTLGQKIQTLLNKTMPLGHHEMEFNGQNLPSGIYFYKIEAGIYQRVRKMMLLR